VVHINAGIAGLVGCLMIGKRIGYGKEFIAPHSVTMNMIGVILRHKRSYWFLGIE